MLWAGGWGRTARHFPLGPGWASGCVKPLTPLGGGVDKGQPLVLGSQSPASHSGYGRGAENKIGATGLHSLPQRHGKRAEGERFPRR